MKRTHANPNGGGDRFSNLLVIFFKLQNSCAQQRGCFGTARNIQKGSEGGRERGFPLASKISAQQLVKQ